MSVVDRQSVGASTAPIYTIPQERVVSIEHPCIVRNFDNGLKSLGGEPQMKHALEHRVGDSLTNPEKPLDEPVIGVSLRPRDPLSKKLVSTAIESRNVLVKVTLPKRTGRKRKRGSNDPYTHHNSPEHRNDSIAAPEFLQRLKDTSGKYTLTPIGTISETHRFRNLPDFQMAASDNAMMRELVTHALKPSHAALRALRIDKRPGAHHIKTFVAPPTFMAATQPYRYEFQQASGVKFSADAAGNITTTNIQAPPRRVVAAVEPDALEVPQGPPPNLKRHHTFGTHLDDAVAAIRALLETRALVTRRVAMNFIPQYSDTVFKEATQWVGYSFRAGPWRDSLIKYGVDPRKDPKYRAYQTLMFQLDKRAGDAERPGPEGWLSHIFDGANVTHSGKTWQICDVTDPLLKSIFDTEAVQEECDLHQFGWYYNGTLCKARAIMRDKMDHLFRGVEPPQSEYEKIARMPECITRDRLAETYLEDTEVGSKSTPLAIEIRSMARLGAKNTENRAKEKRLKAAIERAGRDGGSFDGVEDEEEEEEEEDGMGGGAIDPGLMDGDVDDGDETVMQGDLEADDEEDADADLEAAGNLMDDDEEDGGQQQQEQAQDQDGE